MRVATLGALEARSSRSLISSKALVCCRCRTAATLLLLLLMCCRVTWVDEEGKEEVAEMEGDDDVGVLEERGVATWPISSWCSRSCAITSHSSNEAEAKGVVPSSSSATAALVVEVVEEVVCHLEKNTPAVVVATDTSAAKNRRRMRLIFLVLN